MSRAMKKREFACLDKVKAQVIWSDNEHRPYLRIESREGLYVDSLERAPSLRALANAILRALEDSQ